MTVGDTAGLLPRSRLYPPWQQVPTVGQEHDEQSLGLFLQETQETAGKFIPLMLIFRFIIIHLCRLYTEGLMYHWVAISEHSMLCAN